VARPPARRSEAAMRDVIIIGAGTAGCVLAERLTRSGRLGVTLVEAGGAPSSRFVSIPAGFAKLFKGELDWAYESEPQAAVGGRRIFTPRGKMLGGSANMNAQMHQWCHPADFDGWAAAGATGWGWAEVAPVFRAQERWGGADEDGGETDRDTDRDADRDAGRNPGRGRSGPMRIEPNRHARPLTHQFVEAARAAGLGRAEHYNGHAYAGAWVAELAHKDGKRFSVYDACLKPAMQRRNLEVITGAPVSRIVIDGGRATGVALQREAGEQILAVRAVVLSAGAFASPQILLHSGIGPAAVLRRFGITPRVDSPEVGENLQDHPVLPLAFATHSTDTLLRAESPRELLRYLLFRRGMLASNGVEGFAFTQVMPGPVAAPDLELLMLPFDAHPDFLTPPREHAFCLAPAVVAPRSRGRVFLRSADPLAPPGIDPAVLSDAEGVDARVLCAGVRLSRRIAATLPLAGTVRAELRPGLGVQSDREILDYARTALQTVYHPTSTCRMGSDARAVVDPRLKLRGVDALWVADASVMPAVPRGHPNAVVAMIAERGGGWIEQALSAPGGLAGGRHDGGAPHVTPHGAPEAAPQRALTTA